jgi:hypothetical protein
MVTLGWIRRSISAAVALTLFVAKKSNRSMDYGYSEIFSEEWRKGRYTCRDTRNGGDLRAK